MAHPLLYVHGFRMLLSFVLSDESTKSTKLNRIQKFSVRTQFFVRMTSCTKLKIFLPVLIFLFFFFYSILFFLTRWQSAMRPVSSFFSRKTPGSKSGELNKAQIFRNQLSQPSFVLFSVAWRRLCRLSNIVLSVCLSVCLSLSLSLSLSLLVFLRVMK